MAEMVFMIEGGGDMSVGIPDTHATVTVQDNYKEVNKPQQELFREFLQEFYDIPKGRGSVLTLGEYQKEQEAEQRFYDEMKADSERDRELSNLDYIAERTLYTQE